MIIGIGGISRAGKSSLADFIKWAVEGQGQQCLIIRQDEFVYEEGMIPKIFSRPDWEHPQSIQWTRFHETIIRAAKQAEVVIAEGLFAFFNPEINQLFDKRIFLEISKGTFFERKRHDNRWAPEPDWYIHHIWSSYLIYGQTIKNSGLPYDLINGEQSISLSQIKNLLKKTELELNG